MKYLFPILLVLALATSCSEKTASPDPEASSPGLTPRTPSDSSDDPPAKPEKSGGASTGGEVTLAFVGDMHFEANAGRVIEKGFGPISKDLKAADFTMGNFEAALTRSKNLREDPKGLEVPSNRYHFRAGPRALDALALAGFDAVSLANNHGADYGLTGLREALEIEDDSPIGLVGLGEDREAAFEPHRFTMKGQEFAFFAVDASKLESRTPGWNAGVASPGLAAARGEGLDYLLKRVEEEDSFVGVFLHWGPENESCPDQTQRNLAMRLSRAGADLLVGASAHRLQGAGWAPSGTAIAYGLGNFLWYHGRTAETGVLNVKVEDGHVTSMNLTPALIPLDGGAPRPAGPSTSRVKKEFAALRSCAGLRTIPLTEEELGPFKSSVSTLSPAIRSDMLGKSHRPSCPLSLDELRLVRVSYVDFAGVSRVGELVVAKSEAEKIVRAFRKLYAARFPIARIARVDKYGGSDERSMAANNTSGYNCRAVAGTTRWSEHSYGRAIDINPVQNPYVRGEAFEPLAAKPFVSLDRSKTSLPKGVIGASGPVVRAFRSVGWEWGGSFEDYQHFSASGG